MAHFKIIHVAGGANAGAESDPAQVFDPQDASFPTTLVYSNNRQLWTSVNHQCDRKSGNPAFGIEVQLAEQTVHQGGQYAIIKHSAASMLSAGWAPGNADFVAWQATVAAALLELTNGGHTFEHEALLWIHGEDDAGNNDAAYAYQANLEALFDAVQTEIGPGVPFFAVEVGSGWGVDFAATINAAIAQAAAGRAITPISVQGAQIKPATSILVDYGHATVARRMVESLYPRRNLPFRIHSSINLTNSGVNIHNNGLFRAQLITQHGIYTHLGQGNYDTSTYNETVIRNALNADDAKYKKQEGLIVYDIEDWEMDGPVEEVQDTIRRMCEVMAIAKDEAPRKQIGIYPVPPRKNWTATRRWYDYRWDNPLSGNYASAFSSMAALRRVNRRYEYNGRGGVPSPVGLDGCVDFFAPDLYIPNSTDIDAWVLHAIDTIQSARKLADKPVYPYISPYVSGLTVQLPESVWLKMLETMWEHADGAIIYTYPNLNVSHVWWQKLLAWMESKNLKSGTAPMVIAPSLVQAPTQPVDTGDTVFYQIENTGGSATYAVVSGALPTGLTLNMTTGVVSGTVADAIATYTATVRATNSAGTSDADVVFDVETAGPVPSEAPKPLDEIATGAHIALAPFIVTDSYSGPLVEVERDDTTTQDIGADAYGRLDTAALLAFCGAGDGWVRTWYDQSGNGAHVTAATNAAKIVEAGEVIRDYDQTLAVFVQANQQFVGTLASALPNNDATFFFVGRLQNIAGQVQQLVQVGPDADLVYLFRTDGTNPSFVVSDGSSGAKQWNEQVWTPRYKSIVDMTVRAADMDIRVNLDTVVSDSHSVPSFQHSRLELGGGSIGFHAQAVFVFPALSTADRNAIYASLNQEYQCGPVATPAGALLPTRYRWQTDVREWWTGKVEADFDMPTNGFSWDETYADIDDLARMWLDLTNDLGSLRACLDMLSESGHYMLDNGAGKGIETGDGGTTLKLPYTKSGPAHDTNLAAVAAWLYTFSLPLAGGGEGNTFKGLSGVANRGIAHGLAYFSEKMQQIGIDRYYDNADLANKGGIALAEIIKGLKDAPEFDDDTKTAVRAGMIEHLHFVYLEDYYPHNANLIVEVAKTVGGVMSVWSDDTVMDALCKKVMRKVLFGKADGTPTDLAAGSWYRGWGIEEGGGIDIGYGGRSIESLCALYASVKDLAGWEFIGQVIDSIANFLTDLRLPDGPTAVTTMVGMNSRTGNADEQNNNARRVIFAHAMTDAAMWAPTLPDAAGMITSINSAIASLNTDEYENSPGSITNGWNNDIIADLPRTLAPTSTWPAEMPYYSGVPFYAAVKAIQDTGGEPVLWRHQRETPINRTHGVPDPEFWIRRKDDGSGVWISWTIEGLRTTQRPISLVYDAWTGGQCAVTIDDAPIIQSVHGKSGDGDGDATEDTGRWGRVRDVPKVGFFSDHANVILSVGVIGTNVIEIAGDMTNLYEVGKSYRIVKNNATIDNGPVPSVTAISYNGTSENTEITISSVADITAGDSIGKFWSSAYARDTCDRTVTTDGGGDVTGWTVTGDITSGSGGTTGTGGVGNGQIDFEVDYQELSDGLQINATITADATAQAGEYTGAINFSLPIHLRDPDVSGTDATIEYDTGASWAVLTTAKVSTQYLRVTHFYSSGAVEKVGYVWFPSAVTLSAADIYQQIYGNDKRLRNVVIDLHGTEGSPILWPASKTFTANIRTAEPPVIGQALSMQVNYPSSSNPNVPIGEPVAVQMTRFGGIAPTFSVKCSTDGGSTYPTTITGHWYDDGTIYEFIGDDQSSGMWPVGVTHVKVVGNDGAGDVDSNSVTLNADAIALHHDDNFTDTNGTLWTDHVATPGPDGGPPNPTDPYCYIQSNNLVVVDGSYRGSQHLPGDSSVSNRRWVVEIKERVNGGASRTSDYGFRVAFKCRNDQSFRYVSPTVVGTTINWTGANVTFNNGPSENISVVAGNAIGGEWITVRAWGNEDMCVAQFWDSDGTYMGGSMVTNVENAVNHHGIGTNRWAHSPYSGEMEYLKVWRFD